MKILSVDDSGIIRKIIRSAAETLGYECLEAENGERGLAILSEHGDDICLVILDWNMPIKDGFTTLKEIKSHPVYSKIPVMMVTTEAERSNIISAIQTGASNYLTKPFTQEDLMSKMMSCIGAAV